MSTAQRTDPAPAPSAAPTGLSGFDAADVERRRALRKMKVVATGLLVFAAGVYLLTRWIESRDGADAAGWVAYVRAASEAGMVGALADWFAVTALFRQPLGLPIPHTALIRRKKDQIGDQLGGFVEQNFMTPSVIEGQVEKIHLPQRVSRWMADPRNSDRISEEASRAIGLAGEMLADEDVEQLIVAGMRWMAEPQWGPPAGRVLEQLIEENRLAPIIAMLCDRAHDWALDSQGLIDRVIDKDGPAWAPKFLNAVVGERIHRELVDFTNKVRSDPDHEVRRAMNEFLENFAQDLQHDKATIERLEAIKAEFIGRDEVAGAASSAWKAAKAVLEQALDDPDSTLRATLADAVIKVATRVSNDEALQAKMNFWTVRVARHVAANYATEIVSVITETVRGWDAEDTSRKIELQVGRDLQFIRINGTVVGSLAGLAIYSISVLLFG